MADKFAATWVSHTSMSDFLACPRSYFLKNVYKDPKTNHKVQIMSPALALGQAVHDVLESLSILPTSERFKISLLERFDTSWKKVSGKKGGFTDADTEFKYKLRGEEMLRHVIANPGPLKRKAIKIKQDLPHYWLSETDEIILCGKIDWLEYLEEQEAVHIIDFKTGKSEERADSLQLPIYYVLVKNTQHRNVAKASYWYLTLNEDLTEKELPDAETSHARILEIAKQIKLARKLERYVCPNGAAGCRNCIPFEKVISGKAELVGVNVYKQDIYILPPSEPGTTSSMPESEIL